VPPNLDALHEMDLGPTLDVIELFSSPEGSNKTTHRNKTNQLAKRSRFNKIQCLAVIELTDSDSDEEGVTSHANKLKKPITATEAGPSRLPPTASACLFVQPQTA